MYPIKKRSVEIRNYIYPIVQVGKLVEKQGWYQKNLAEVPVDDSMKAYFEKNNSLEAFDRIKGNLIVYGIHFKRN